MGKNRIWQVDALRGVAVVLMVVFHFFFDLNYLGMRAISLYEGPFLLLQRITAFLFLTLVGVSLVLANPDFKKTKRRFFLLAAVALGITAATLVYPGRGAIFFGIIHLIALSVLIGHFFLRFDWLNLFFGSLFVLGGFLASGFTVSTPYLLWLGLRPAGFYTLDYYPLFPWFGLVLIGIFAGKRLFKTRSPSKSPDWSRLFQWLGRNALAIYLLHQPVLLGILYLVRSGLSVE